MAAGIGAQSAVSLGDQTMRSGSYTERDLAKLLSDDEAEARAVLDARYSRVYQCDVRDFGAVGDYSGEDRNQATDNLDAFQRALDAVEPGGRVFVSPGRYYLSDTLVIDKTIDFDCGRGGFESGMGGTQLLWAAGKTGLRIRENSEGHRPSGYRIGPFELTSLSESTTHAEGYGIHCTNGFGQIDAVSVSSFGSHGIFLQAGKGVGGGNVNNSDLRRVRCYGNHGDGIRCEGSDAQQIRIWGPDVVANRGWGINMVGSSANRVYSPHFDQQYFESPGAIRDAGNSNTYEDVYTESGRGSGSKILLDAGSLFARVTTSQYARPEVVDNTLVKTAQVIDVETGFARRVGVLGAEGTQVFLDADAQESGVVRLQVDGETKLSWHAETDEWITVSPIRPRTSGEIDLGTPGHRFGSAHFESFVRIGTVDGNTRPSAASAGAGATLFDRALGKPIWSNGSFWIDANGRAI
ncbi:hypothetical protein [Mycetocola manganoxydans]|uniref:hypothetical protein n=1 Tax=Mycetocola manganoxydans TaxID=699879 RepID=UPI0011C428F3|nr:hypothetical protein [Mycetocola manganoxydans]